MYENNKPLPRLNGNGLLLIKEKLYRSLERTLIETLIAITQPSAGL